MNNMSLEITCFNRNWGLNSCSKKCYNFKQCQDWHVKNNKILLRKYELIRKYKHG